MQKLTHPDSDHKVVVETNNPEPYLSQGWIEKDSQKSDK